MSAQAAQPVPKSQPKVLRIGLVREGKIQERLLRPQETVTVGDSARVTIPVQGTRFGARHELLVPRGEGYVLQVPDWVEGKLQSRDGMADIGELRGRPTTQRKGDLFLIPVDESTRGKVVLGPVALLFQFVPAPPEPIKPITAADFRPRLIDEDDPLFLGLLGVFTLIASAFMVWVYTAEVSEEIDIEAVAEVFDLEIQKEPEQVVIETPGEQKVEAKVEEKPPEKPAAPPTTTATPAPTVGSVAKKSVLLQMLGTDGAADGRSAVEDLLGDESAAMAGLDQALAGVSGAQTATASSLGTKQGSGGGREDAKVGVGVATGGTSGTSNGAAVVIKKPKVDYGTADAIADAGDASSIPTVIRKNSGRIQSCVEQGLKQNPDMSGRVSIKFDINAGKVTSSSVVSNTTGNSQVGTCIATAIRAIRFDPGLTAQVDEMPFAVSGQ